MGNFSQIYRYYKYRVFPKVKNIRGTTRLLKMLERFAYSEMPAPQDNPTPLRNLDWQNLIILDACRFDLYNEVTGSEDYRISLGSASGEAIEKNFSDGDWSDTVLVTANPHFADEIFEEKTGRKIEDVFHCVFKTFNTDWDSEKSTVTPKDMVKNALTAEKLFPGKRKIIWFMQPHHPFLDSSLEDVGFDPNLEQEAGEKIWSKAERGVYDDSEIWQAYRQNLEKVMPYTKQIAEELDGRTIVTSDHGNLVGENNLYGHPGEQDLKYLKKVPLDVL
jgi:hypothetical protein